MEKELWTQRLRFVRRNRWFFLAVVAAFAAAAPLVAWMQPEPLRWVSLGALAVGCGWFCHALVLTFDGTVLRFNGTLAERWTGDLLRRAGWQVRAGLVFATSKGQADVDHVAVSPRGAVLAVETKYTTCAWDLQAYAAQRPGPGYDRIRSALRQAGWSARRVKAVLACDPGLRNLPAPKAVLVLWGPGIGPLERGVVEIEGVTVLVGNQGEECRAWLRDEARVEAEGEAEELLVRRIVAALDAHLETVRPPSNGRLFDGSKAQPAVSGHPSGRL